MTIPGEIADLLGVGFGPAAIALAVAIEDEHEAHPAQPRLRTQFVERAANSAWQPNMLLSGTDIQHHYLRDYATPRNPRSRFTFPCYLLDTGRFYQFTLMNWVSRQEWSAYTEWVAERITLPVRHDVEVTEVTPVTSGGTVVAARVTGVDLPGREYRWVARNVVLSPGHTPFVPEVFAPLLGERVFHSSDYLTRLAAAGRDRPQRIAVIGAGQNAGEIILHLAGALPDAEIHSLARNSGFRMYNLGHFSNEAYFPDETDYFYGLDSARRAKVFGEVHSTNYASVDPDVSTALYRTVYEDRHWGPGRLHLRKRTAVDACHAAPAGGYRLALREVNTGEASELDVDLIILCTGFREPKVPAMLAAFDPFIDRDETGDPVVSRAFRLGTTPDCEAGLYLNGITEWRHGINSATSFSTMAVKGGEILRDIQRHRAPTAPAANGRTGSVASRG